MSRPVYILGLSCFYHDAAAALLMDGVPIAAAEEERFTRKKHDAAFPAKAATYCLQKAGIPAERLDHVVFYDKPILKLDRILATFLATWPRGLGTFAKGLPGFLAKKLWVESGVRRELGWPGEVLYSDHHLSHAASAALLSGFEESAVLTLDGVGEWTCAMGATARGAAIEPLWELRFPHSPGLLYSAFTQYLGFRVNSAEYKVMGLAPYGKPIYRDLILDRLVRLRPDGSFRLNLEHFEFTWGQRMIGPAFEKLFGRPARAQESGEPEQFHADVAASIQAVLNEITVAMAADLRERSGMSRLCMAGGVALNCVANERIRREAGYEAIFIQPAAGDAGGALGAAALVDRQLAAGEPRPALSDVYLGPEYSQAEIDAFLSTTGARPRRLEREALLSETARRIASGRVVAWFQGRMEFGPRALGNRSILADARSEGMRNLLNAKIKFRESFRPFAPAVAAERSPEWFELDGESPYMLLAPQVRPGKTPLPAITHVDGSARLQTVSKKTNPLFHALLAEYEKLTGVPVIVNTSFNVRGEPIVCSPADAWRTFVSSGIDDLVLGEAFIAREEQPAEVVAAPRGAVDLD